MTAGIICSFVGVLIVSLASNVGMQHFGGQDINRWEIATRLLSEGGVIGTFAALLGPNGKWWPWSLAPIAFFLSQGPSNITFFRWNPEGLTIYSFFGLVLPLFAIGLIAGAWQPLAAKLARRPAPITEPVRPAVPVLQRRVFPGSIYPNAVALALVAVSVLIFVADPFPAHLQSNLPTFLGSRNRANDVRARMNLWQAMGDMNAYRSRTGSYSGFDAMDGRFRDPSLVWANGLPKYKSHVPGCPCMSAPPLTVEIVRASNRSAQVATLSNSGIAFCLERSPPKRPRYGEETGGPPNMSAAPPFRSAIQNCGSNPWTARALIPPPYPECIANTTGFLICRMVQVLMFDILKSKTPLA